MIDVLLANWEWIMLGFYTLEKIVKLSPSKKDDIIFDSVIKPLFDKCNSVVVSISKQKFHNSTKPSSHSKSSHSDVSCSPISLKSKHPGYGGQSWLLYNER